jgi:hypothetical protein
VSLARNYDPDTDPVLCYHGNESGNCVECAMDRWQDDVDMIAKEVGRGDRN